MDSRLEAAQRQEYRRDVLRQAGLHRVVRGKDLHVDDIARPRYPMLVELVTPIVVIDANERRLSRVYRGGMERERPRCIGLVGDDHKQQA
jgi:hypothetical protein